MNEKNENCNRNFKNIGKYRILYSIRVPTIYYFWFRFNGKKVVGLLFNNL